MGGWKVKDKKEEEGKKMRRKDGIGRGKGGVKREAIKRGREAGGRKEKRKRRGWEKEGRGRRNRRGEK